MSRRMGMSGCVATILLSKLVAVIQAVSRNFEMAVSSMYEYNQRIIQKLDVLGEIADLMKQDSNERRNKYMAS